MIEPNLGGSGLLHTHAASCVVPFDVTRVASVVFEVVVTSVMGSTKCGEVVDVGIAAPKPRGDVVDLGLGQRGGAPRPGTYALHREQCDPLRQ